MKTFSFNLKTTGTVKAALGRNMENVPAQFPELFRSVDKVCLVTGSDAPPSLRARALALFPEGARPHAYFWLPPSEKAKTLEQAGRLCSFLFGEGFSRGSLLIAAGGGAVTDLAGFAASVYMRGIRWVSAPTTFLAQIDAGLGGKTAVNLAGAKNIVGTFHQPALAVCDTAFLDSLPHAELRSGAGELVKYAMIGPGDLFRTVKKNLSKVLAGDRAALTSCVSACAAYKLKLVARDERDERGVREALNFGHTAGHAFEAMSAGRLPHGEAVARGLRFALIASRGAGILSKKDHDAMDALVGALRLKPALVRRDFRHFLSLVSRDKKARGANNRFVLAAGPGRLCPAEDLDAALLKKAFEGALK
ncbi:MAG: 3-dehydroquinate synthase [Elusimicrobia bacterium HGW-Elusimicrobia-3]|nr:MAG: 3-dehydroquinate synthase [Elusimicrobia bacterium HGW-Elusimicrobia-3]